MSLSSDANASNKVALIVDEETVQQEETTTVAIPLPTNVCFCTDGKRLRCCAGKVHLIGCDDEEAPASKRVKLENRGSCLEGDTAECVRRYMKGVL